mgnify:FL=1
MIRVSEIDSLLGLVGFRQSSLSGYTTLMDAGNIASSSGLYVNDVSGLITTKNIKNSQEDTAISDANFNTFIDNRQKSSFITLCKSVFSDNDLIENKSLFVKEADFQHLLTNATDFVGYEIDVAKAKDINVVLNKIMLTFNAIEEVTVYLFHSENDALNQSEAITTVADSTKHTFVNWDLPAADGVTGGKWYVGYLRSGLTARAYDRDYQDANHQTTFSCLGITPIQVSGWDANTLFDVNDVDYVSETWGMNFDFSSFRDYTSVVVENRDRFARGLQLQIAADLLNLFATTTRSNRDERIIKTEALYDLNGNRSNPEIPTSVGVLNQLADEVKNLKRMFGQPVIQYSTMR